MVEVVLTGDRPSGPLHLGHYVGSLVTRLQLQKTPKYRQYVMVADLQALTDYAQSPELVRTNVSEVVMDYLAVGLDPSKSVIFVQSGVPELAELTIYLMNLVSLGRLKRNPTVKAEIAQKAYDERSVSVGFLCYPISQAADITAFKAELVPVGEDQAPMIEQTNEIVRKFNSTYNASILKEAKALFSTTSRLVGLDGKAKASKSLNNAISLKDTPDEIRSKVFSMFTDPNHIRVNDPGQVEGNVVFSYLDALYEDRQDLQELKARYSRGGLGDVVIKSLLNDVLQKLLLPIRESRRSISKDVVQEVLSSGTEKARKVAATTLLEVREAMRLI